MTKPVLPWANPTPNHDIAALRREIAAGKLEELTPEERKAYALVLVAGWEDAYRVAEAHAESARICADEVRQANEARQRLENVFRAWAKEQGIDPGLD